MMTFDDIKESFNNLSDTQKQLVTDLVIDAGFNVHCAEDLADHATKLLKAGELNEFSGDETNYTEKDYKAVISYLSYASNYHLPEIYIAPIDEENLFLTRDDFDCVSFEDYVDVQSTMDNLWTSIYQFILNPETTDKPDLCEYNDHFFENEMLDHIKQHNSELTYYCVVDGRLAETYITLTKDAMNDFLNELEDADSYHVNVCDYKEISKEFTDEEIAHYID